jgi:predicted  nucleic acid-binding Zn-ribbon protein
MNQIVTFQPNKKRFLLIIATIILSGGAYYYYNLDNSKTETNALHDAMELDATFHAGVLAAQSLCIQISEVQIESNSEDISATAEQIEAVANQLPAGLNDNFATQLKRQGQSIKSACATVQAENQKLAQVNANTSEVDKKVDAIKQMTGLKTGLQEQQERCTAAYQSVRTAIQQLRSTIQPLPRTLTARFTNALRNNHFKCKSEKDRALIEAEKTLFLEQIRNKFPDYGTSTFPEVFFTSQYQQGIIVANIATELRRQTNH